MLPELLLSSLKMSCKVFAGTAVCVSLMTGNAIQSGQRHIYLLLVCRSSLLVFFSSSQCLGDGVTLRRIQPEVGFSRWIVRKAASTRINFCQGKGHRGIGIVRQEMTCRAFEFVEILLPYRNLLGVGFEFAWVIGVSL